jgi:DNA polymerase-3 subunit epsilon
MTFWYEGPLLSLDTETTGVDVFTDRIVTCNITYDVPGQEPYIANWMINPGVEIAEGASAVHGITNEVAQEQGGDPYDVLNNIADHLRNWEKLGHPVVIYNASFDATLLTVEFDRYGVRSPTGFTRVIDPLVLDKGLDKYRRGSRKLIDTARHYGIELREEDAHSADFDAMASVKVSRAIGRKYEIDFPIEDVVEMQKAMKAEQAASFQKYLREKRDEEGNLIDPFAVINGEWPIQTTKETHD